MKARRANIGIRDEIRFSFEIHKYDGVYWGLCVWLDYYVRRNWNEIGCFLYFYFALLESPDGGGVNGPQWSGWLEINVVLLHQVQGMRN